MHMIQIFSRDRDQKKVPDIIPEATYWTLGGYPARADQGTHVTPWWSNTFGFWRYSVTINGNRITTDLAQIPVHTTEDQNEVIH